MNSSVIPGGYLRMVKSPKEEKKSKKKKKSRRFFSDPHFKSDQFKNERKLNGFIILPLLQLKTHRWDDSSSRRRRREDERVKKEKKGISPRIINQTSVPHPPGTTPSPSPRFWTRRPSTEQQTYTQTNKSRERRSSFLKY